ncbi:hypothetical protein XANCAGTX0491_008169 [Xanthoria calcicola]
MVATVRAAVIPANIRESHAQGSKLNATSILSFDPLINTKPISGGLFPPGYPRSQYRYHVRGSTITLVCVFRYKPRIKHYQVDVVLRKSIMQYGDPRQQDDSVYKGVARAWDVHSSKENEGVTYLTIRVNARHPREMTYGQALDALTGVNRIRTEWSKIDMGCRIHNIYQNKDIDLGDIELYYNPAANPYLRSTE